jgi:hypothetical protein
MIDGGVLLLVVLFLFAVIWVGAWCLLPRRQNGDSGN